MENLIIYLLGLVWDESRRENYKIAFISIQSSISGREENPDFGA